MCIAQATYFGDKTMFQTDSFGKGMYVLYN